CSNRIRSLRPLSMRTEPRSNDRSQLRRCTGPWRCFLTGWQLRQIESFTTHHVTQASSDFAKYPSGFARKTRLSHGRCLRSSDHVSHSPADLVRECPQYLTRRSSRTPGTKVSTYTIVQ